MGENCRLDLGFQYQPIKTQIIGFLNFFSEVTNESRFETRSNLTVTNTGYEKHLSQQDG